MYEQILINIPRNITGIYKITNKETGMIYIGQAIDIRRRLLAHIAIGKQIAQLNPDNSTHSPIDVSLSKHSAENYTWEIVEQCLKEELDQKEIYWIKYYDSYNHGYNATLGGSGSRQWPSYVTEIQQQLMTTNLSYQEIADNFNIDIQIVSNINRGLHYYNEELTYPLREWKKKVIQYDLYGNELHRYDSIADACRAIQTDSHSAISQVCLKKEGYKSYKGFIWRYEDDPLTEKIHTGRSRKTILQIDLNGNIVGRYISGPDAEKQTGFNRKCITNVCADTTGRHKTYKGYYWKYEED